MSEEIKQDFSQASPQAEPDVVSLIKKIQTQLTYLEKKLDLLIKQTSQQPREQGHSSRERHFTKPYRSFDRSHRHGKGERDGGFAGQENRGFSHKKKAYDNPHGEKRGFEPKKKPFYYGRRERG